MGLELASKEGKKGEGTARPSSHAQKFCPPSLADGKRESKRSLETFRLFIPSNYRFEPTDCRVGKSKTLTRRRKRNSPRS